MILRPNFRRIWRFVWLGILLVLLCAIGALVWLSGREQTLQWVVQQALVSSRSSLPGTLQIEGVKGSLTDTIHIASLRYRSAEQLISAQQISLQWTPVQLLLKRIAVRQLDAKSLSIETLKSSDQAPSLPTSLALPFPVRIGDVRLNKLVIIAADTSRVEHANAEVNTSAKKITSIDNLHFGLSADGHDWRLSNASADTEWGKINGGLSLLANRPFTIGGKIDFVSAAQPDNTNNALALPAKITATINGNLSDLLIAANTESQGAKAATELRLRPFETQPIQAIKLTMSGVNPARFQANLPVADLSVELSSVIDANRQVDGKFTLINHSPPGTLDQQRLPVRSVTSAFSTIYPDTSKGAQFDPLHLLTLRDASIDLGAAGKFVGQGQLKDGIVSLKLHTDGVNLQAIQSTLRPTKIAGDIVFGSALTGAANIQTVQASLKQDDLQLDLDASLNAGVVQIAQARLRSNPQAGKVAVAANRSSINSISIGSSELNLSGEFALAEPQHFKASGVLQHFNPAQFGTYPVADLNSDFKVEGQLLPAWQVAADIALRPSRLYEQSFTGHGKFLLDAQHVQQLDASLKLGGNQMQAQGSFGAANDKLQWQIDAHQLQVLNPELGGAISGKGTLAGTAQLPAITFAFDGSALKYQQISIKAVRASGHLDAGINGPLQADVDLSEIASANAKNPADSAVTLENLHLIASGSRAAHSVQLTAKNTARRAEIDAQLELRGGWHGATSPAGAGSNVATKAAYWDGKIVALSNRGRYAFGLQAPAALRVGSDQVMLNDAVLTLPNGNITLQSLEKTGQRWHSTGQANGVPLNYVLQFSPELAKSMREMMFTDLHFGAKWNLDMDQAVNGSLRITRETGDVTMRTELPLALGISALEARLDIVNNAIKAQLDMRAAQAGTLHFDAAAQLAQAGAGWIVPKDSALTLNGNASMSSIAWLAVLSGQPGLELDGKVTLALHGTGTAGAPQLSGDVTGDKLLVRWLDEGLKLRNGQFQAHFDGDQMVLKQLRFDGDEGNLALSGSARYADEVASMQLKLVADKLQILARPDRVLVVSGQSNISLDKRRVQLDGKFKADRASIELASNDTPTLSDDVIVLGAKGKPVAKAAAPIPFLVDLDLDLGDQFFLKGKGLDAQLGGSLHVKSNESRIPRAIGSVNVVKGSYAAYGQRLQIDRGVISFTGPLDNPGINILAVRKKKESETEADAVVAGVEVRGTALAPRAKLVSTPNVPDSEKLSWLVLGHGSAGTSQQEFNVLGAAASAVFGASESRLANSFGVDEIGIAQGQSSTSGQAQGLENTVLTVGKRLSSRAYLSYEQGASSATRLVKLRYALNARLSIQAQTGSNNALDLLYSWVFD